jgi:serine/threonine protein kinase
MKPTARRRLGKYVLLGRLGAGGMGKIYLAHAPGPAGIDKLLVVKRLHGHLTNDPVLVTSFLDEARLSMALNHPNIVHTYDVGDVDGRYFIVMEYIDGQNLGVLLRTAKRSGSYPKSTLWAGLFSNVLEGLHAAHVAKDARGRPLQLIHRDVSPQNVLVTYEGMPKLVDFGIAKAAMRVSETDAGTLKGKYAYMSPEQVNGEQLDPRSDVFAAGIVLWEMLAGRRLYKADTIVRSVERVLTEPPVSPTRVNPDVDERLARVCVKALQKARERRFASAEEMKDALDDALAAMGHRYRPAETRELMQRLFADVIDKQRAVLESSLNATGEHADDDDDEPRRARANDSQSDLRMPQLRVSAGDHESTTPSALKRSPLVTAEDAPARRGDGDGDGHRDSDGDSNSDREDDGEDRDARGRAPVAVAPPPALEPDTAVGRQRPARADRQATRGAAGLAEVTSSLHGGAGASSSTSPPGRAADVAASLPQRSGEASTSALTATQSSRALAEFGGNDGPPAPRRRWLVPVTALGSGVIAATLAVFVGGYGLPKTTIPATTPPATTPPATTTPATTTPATTTPATTTPATTPATGAGPADVAGSVTGGGVGVGGDAGAIAGGEPVGAGGPVGASGRASSGGTDGGAGGDDGDDGDDDDALPAGSASAPAKATVQSPPAPRPPPRPAPRPAARPAVPPSKGGAAGDGDAAGPVATEMGFLTLDTVPWTTVYLGKKKLGETPLVKVAVPAGELELLLVNPEAKVNESYVARVKPGAVFRTRLDLR